MISRSFTAHGSSGVTQEASRNQIMEKLNVGVVGLGKMGLLHAGIFNELEPALLSRLLKKRS